MKAFSGVITALVTPFLDQKIDEQSFVRLVQQQVKDGIQGFVINGTTAESPTLKWDEVEQLFHLAKANTPSHFPLIVGTGSNSTEQTCENSKRAEKLGADAVLVVVPYYNKPPQSGLLQHFQAVADAVKIPVILYNVPSRTITGLEAETIQKLSEHPNIIGIKEASGSIAMAKTLRKLCGEKFLLLSGDDVSFDDFMQAGGDGVISVSSHIMPKAMLEVRASDHLELIQLLFSEPNPIPVKAALKAMGIIRSSELRLPLVEMSPGPREKLMQQMHKEGFL